MDVQKLKAIIVVDYHLTTGLAVNASSIVACMITTTFPELMGPPVKTSDGELPGVVLSPLPVLAGDSTLLASVWSRANNIDPKVSAFPFTQLAQGCKTYKEYEFKLKSAVTHELPLAAIGLCGPFKVINSLTGDLPLYPAKG